ncbi:MAG TPA: hypothetical protein VNA26_09580 [Chitinophagaceae bacterium]|nr:hypothetical protein [Chitinophagaceae bacterium]
MLRLLFLSVIIIFISSCSNDKNKPDVSDIKIDLQVLRFEKDFFKIDINNISSELARLEKTYPTFLPIYMKYVLGLENDSTNEKQVKFFIEQSRFLIDSTQKKYRDFGDIEEDLTSAFKFVKYYYPDYQTPKIITLIGPVDALAKMGDTYTPNFLGPDFLALSLQFYLGKKFSLYGSDRYIMEIAPLYRSRRFDKEFLVADAMKLIADDLYEDQTAGRPLVEQMVEKGKAWYILDLFLPDAPDSIKTGFTQKQLDWAEENEGNVWAYIIKNEDLYSIEPATLQVYLGEAPFTQGFPESSPGNIGQWIGWRIVQKFAENNPEMSLQQILQTPAKTIFEGAKYRPK